MSYKVLPEGTFNVYRPSFLFTGFDDASRHPGVVLTFRASGSQRLGQYPVSTASVFGDYYSFDPGYGKATSERLLKAVESWGMTIKGLDKDRPLTSLLNSLCGLQWPNGKKNVVTVKKEYNAASRLVRVCQWGETKEDVLVGSLLRAGTSDAVRQILAQHGVTL